MSRANINLNNFFPSPGGVIGEGITCDICHKVIGVTLDDNGYPYADQPGILSFQYPSFNLNNPRISFGPLPSYITKNEPNHANGCFPIYSESSFCAACHYGRFHGVLIYSSYSEWMRSPYSKKKIDAEGNKKKENPGYRSCQDCHMLSPEQIGNSLPSQREACSAVNESFNNFNHNMMLINGVSLIKDAAKLEVKLEGGENTNSIKITVKVTNIKAGHNFPTDSPLRHLILVVEAKDEQGNLLPQADGEKIPVWGGVGVDPNVTGMTNYGGMPGKIFANLLVDIDTNISPTAAYWNPIKLAMANPAKGTDSDTRLKPNKTDESNYTFTLPARGEAYITLKLVYRYAFIDLARQKGWYRPDFDAALKECPPIDVKQPETWECP
ncbi:MAG: hypothetical protein C3F07_10555 [Anaerolineales bacterium]|nr:MAG: hypothetical protein C3F07_10555 [Anaerolineales bacterium]